MSAVIARGRRLIVQREAWMDDALCRGMDPDLFFPERGDSLSEASDVAAAKAVCRDCPVADPCLEYAFRWNEKDGIYGGKSGRERRRIARKRAVARAEARRNGVGW